MRISKKFFQNQDVSNVARSLVGKILYFNNPIRGIIGGRIVETDAYHQNEKACHCFNGRKTKRNAALFEEGGTIYIYLCYGVHHLFNLVTGRKDEGEAVLIRAVQPLYGFNKDANIAVNGPGKWTKAFDITIIYNNTFLGDNFWIEDDFYIPDKVVETTRIGVEYAGKDALLKWRFYESGSIYISKG